MPAPVEGISLADKLAVTRHLSAAGANIEQLNTVRKQLSRIKGGGLLRACRAGRLVSLIISDVLGDPLDLIASGPTVPDRSTPAGRLDVLDQFSPQGRHCAGACSTTCGTAVSGGDRFGRNRGATAVGRRYAEVSNLIIGNNATAVAAAAEEAQAARLLRRRRLAAPIRRPGRRSRPQLGRMASGIATAAHRARTCLISGGEPVVKLVDHRGAVWAGETSSWCWRLCCDCADDGAEGIALLSGGTDGEDGPTDAAGAFLDADVLAAARRKRLDPADFLARNDAYHFFEPLGALIEDRSDANERVRLARGGLHCETVVFTLRDDSNAGFDLPLAERDGRYMFSPTTTGPWPELSLTPSRSLGDLALLVGKQIVVFQGLGCFDVDAAADGRHERMPLPNRVDGRFHGLRNAVDFDRELLLAAEERHLPAGLLVVVLLLDVGRGDRQVDQVSQLGIDRRPLGQFGIASW